MCKLKVFLPRALSETGVGVPSLRASSVAGAVFITVLSYFCKLIVCFFYPRAIILNVLLLELFLGDDRGLCSPMMPTNLGLA